MNITLIGMAGVGKSSIGKLLAKKLNYSFVDVDHIIEKNMKSKLQQILDGMGEERFVKIEQKTILELEKTVGGKLNNFVISPGGSAVYSEEAMKFLKDNSVVVFLSAEFEIIEKNITNNDSRGIVGLRRKTLNELFKERLPLYKKYADITIKMPEKFDTKFVVKKIIEELPKDKKI